MERKPRTNTRSFTEWSPEGRAFIKMWNESYRDGAQNKIAEHFGMSIPTVYRLRTKFKLPDLHDAKNHPGKRKFYKRVKRLYRESRSTAYVGRIVGMSSQRINQILKSQKVSLAQKYQTNILLIRPKNGMTAKKFNATIKTMALEEGMTNADIARILHVDQGTVGKRLIAMNIKRSQNHQFAKGGYPCQWCGKIMDQVWIARGKRKQKYCCSSCKNYAKDYRRYKRAHEMIVHYEALLKRAWGDQWKQAADKIMQIENQGGIRRKQALFREQQKGDIHDGTTD